MIVLYVCVCVWACVHVVYETLHESRLYVLYTCKKAASGSGMGWSLAELKSASVESHGMSPQSGGLVWPGLT